MLKCIEHVRGFVKGIPKRLELDSFWSGIESNGVTTADSHEEDQRLSRITQAMNDKLLARTDNEMFSLQTQLVKQRVRWLIFIVCIYIYNTK